MENSVAVLPATELMSLVEKLEKAADAFTTQKKKDKDFVSNDEFLGMMGISKRTAQTWRDAGIISFSQVGGKIYYSMVDISKMLLENRREQFCLTNKTGRKS